MKIRGGALLALAFVLSVPLHGADSQLFHFSPDQPVVDDSVAAANVPGASQTPRSIPRVTSAQRKPMTADEKWNYYLHSTYGPRSLAYTAFGAGLKQARGSVEEWGGGMEGYGRRYASSFGQKVIKRSIQHGLGGLFGEDPRYLRSNKSGIFVRALYAATRVLVAQKDSGGTRIAYTRFIATGSASVISRQWYPERYHNAEDYFTSSVTSLGVDAAKNVLNEFWPDIKKMLGR